MTDAARPHAGLGDLRFEHADLLAASRSIIRQRNKWARQVSQRYLADLEI
jgi:hypothetical protein